MNVREGVYGSSVCEYMYVCGRVWQRVNGCILIQRRVCVGGAGGEVGGLCAGVCVCRHVGLCVLSVWCGVCCFA